MRFVIYKKKVQDGSESTMYVNLDRVDSVNMHPKDSNVTEMYLVTGEDVHLVYEGKIVSQDLVIGKLLSISDRSFVEINKFVKDCNDIAKSKR